MSAERACPSVELWGGVECTVNRVGEGYFDQLERCGHGSRPADLDQLAALGIKALRYPVLWERAAPERGGRPDFTWSDERLARLRALGVRPIVGLVHHGSGPRHTSLVDPTFPEQLACYARAVAERYPWVTDFTPVNEPLTTARFSGLYGHWYPHGRSAATFVRALVTQCRATVLAMQAVRSVTPGARLVQTEDFGTTFATPLLQYQARHENLRRLLSIDLLCGLVGPEHPLAGYLLRTGVTAAELAFFREAPCPPDVLGINYYVTSDRFLDERVERYPVWSHGGNGHHTYADVEAVRVRSEGMSGHLPLLCALARRYGLPLAITEAHLGGGREDQLRWFLEAWQSAHEARRRGLDVRAVTAWSLLGAFDWDSLVVLDRGTYEPGAFDVRSAPPRPTALAGMLKALAETGTYAHPVTCAPGWWRRPARLLYPAVPAPDNAPRLAADSPSRPRVEALAGAAREHEARPLLIAGATGTLGRALARVCAAREIPFRLLSRKEMDIADPQAVRAALDRHSPWAVINAAGYVQVDDAEREHVRCARENTSGPAALAEACAEGDIRFVTFSSDLVFGGAQSHPYVESDDVSPLGVYGKSKVLAEREVMRVHPPSLIVRTSAFFGPWDDRHFLAGALCALEEGRPFHAAADSVVSPTYLPDLVNVTLDLLIDGVTGIWHLANRGAVSWADLAHRTATLAGVDPRTLVRCPTGTLGHLARRPAYSALGSQRGLLLPLLEESLSRYVRDRGVGGWREQAA